MSIKKIQTAGAPAAIGPYSQGAVIGNIVATSGQIPVDPATGKIPDGIKEQAERAFTNLFAVLEAAGVKSENIVSTRIFLTDINDFAAVNGVYQEFFKEPYPARTCVAVSAIPKGAKIEIEALAYKE
ncbi:MAG: Rid family detoxifying hydrolase [Candidatus Methanoplasma sp.]|jgi:2-iminobutanoate/2-iminopropanoate deaminase|nr:Rid family detoxifying hydrolase [Candidatus Methanoplasma sp.]